MARIPLSRDRAAATVTGLVIALLAACNFLPPGDSSVELFMLNNHDQPVVIRYGPFGTDVCLTVAPDAFIKFYDSLGGLDDGVPQFALLAEGGDTIGPLTPSVGNALFVVNGDSTVTEMPAKYRRGPPDSNGLVMDMPTVPGIDGDSAPDYRESDRTGCPPSQTGAAQTVDVEMGPA